VAELRDLRSRSFRTALDCSDSKRDLGFDPVADREQFLERVFGPAAATPPAVLHRDGAMTDRRAGSYTCSATFGAGGPQVRAVQLLASLGPSHQHVVMAMDGRTEAAAMLRENVACEIVAPPPRRGFLATVRTQGRVAARAAARSRAHLQLGRDRNRAAARRLSLPRVHHEDGFGPEEAQRPLRRRSWVRTLVLRKAPVIVPSRVLVRIAQEHWRRVPSVCCCCRTASTCSASGPLRQGKAHPSSAQSVACVPRRTTRRCSWP
jgi:hypothetical protein